MQLSSGTRFPRIKIWSEINGALIVVVRTVRDIKFVNVHKITESSERICSTKAIVRESVYLCKQ